MALAEPIRKLTESEYLEIERAAEFKSEFFDGEVFAMSGGSPRHSLIAVNFVSELRRVLRGKPCRPYNSDLRIKVEASGLITYPDLSVVCGPLEFLDEHGDTVVNPTLIIEVLSPSTEGYDRGKKFDNYRLIPSLREYVLVSQERPFIARYFKKDDGEWVLRDASGVEAVLHLDSLDETVSLAEIYLDVEFDKVDQATNQASPPIV